MSEWIKLDPEKFSSSGRENKRDKGVELSISLSPYDVPDAVRGFYDKRLQRFVIEFRYISSEDWELRLHRDHVNFRVGRNSGRLYGIEIDLREWQARHVELDMRLPKIVDRALEQELTTSLRGRRTEDNYRVAKDVIFDERRPLFAELVGAD
jgi:hypothetical protein